MSGSKCWDLERRVLDHLLRGGATPPLVALSTVYIALTSDVPSDSTPGTEIVDSSCARSAVGATLWQRSGSVVKNTVYVEFPTVTDAGYTARGWDMYDAPSGGNRLYFGTQTPSVTFNIGETPRFQPGELEIAEG